MYKRSWCARFWSQDVVQLRQSLILTPSFVGDSVLNPASQLDLVDKASQLNSSIISSTSLSRIHGYASIPYQHFGPSNSFVSSSSSSHKNPNSRFSQVTPSKEAWCSFLSSFQHHLREPLHELLVFLGVLFPESIARTQMTITGPKRIAAHRSSAHHDFCTLQNLTRHKERGGTCLATIENKS